MKLTACCAIHDGMPKPRIRLVSLSDTPYYHCISRCVRRAFLCGIDRQSGYSVEPRRQWIVERILLLSSVFTIDVCAYAVMSNHYHVVLHVNSAESKQLSAREVALRWLRLFSGPPIMRNWLEGGWSGPEERLRVEQWCATVQKRLADISWFMLLLQRLHIDANQFAAYLRKKPDTLPNALGSAGALLKLAQTFGLKFVRGMMDRKTLLTAD
jgi:hypothetical protein